MTSGTHAPAPDVASILAQLPRPRRAVVTAGMPYANGPLHLGHLAGAHVPADIHARWLGMLIGRENVLFVCGTDDHGSTSEVAALAAGRPIREFIDDIHARQAALARALRHRPRRLHRHVAARLLSDPDENAHGSCAGCTTTGS